VLEPCASNSSRSSTSNLQENVQRGRGTVSSLMTPTPLNEIRTVGYLLPQLHQVPINVTAWWGTSSVDIRPPGSQLNSWVDWNMHAHTHTHKMAKSSAGMQNTAVIVQIASAGLFLSSLPVQGYLCALRYLTLVKVNPPGRGRISNT